jgi:asparagine synthase (glutamine-hydrolysing)
MRSKPVARKKIARNPPPFVYSPPKPELRLNMCGILAFFKADGLSREDIEEARRALDALRHRGPNGDGICLIDSKSGKSWSLQTPDTPADLQTDLTLEAYVAGSADLFLSQRRLSIFDLSSKGHQPMRDAVGNVLIFNGEVYNFIELREELKAQGFSFVSGSDTEVIMAAFRVWGADCFKRFNGMWTIVLYDAQQHKVLVSNDRIGIKQLYYWGKDKKWMYASEIKSIRTLQDAPTAIAHAEADFFLKYGQIDLTTQTLLREVQRFTPAHYIHAHPQQLPHCPQSRYWDFPNSGIRNISLDDAAHELRSLLDDAVKLRMRSDVPWGTTLSGGLDSSSIIYAAAKLRKQNGETSPINTFTAIFPGKAGDESEFVRFIEQDLGLHARYTHPLDEFDFEDFARFMYHQDQPVVSTSMYAQWSVMKAVGDSEITVLLDGQGGDELFGGYHHHFYKYGRSLFLRGRWGELNRLVKEYCDFKGWNPKTVKATIRNDAKLYLKLKLGGKLPGPPEITAWNGASNLTDVLRLDLRSFIMPSLLRYEDRNSMAFGIEARLPFLDYRIVEFALTLPDSHKIQQGWQKYILRKAMPDLPERIRFRKDKKGFTTPHDEWITRFRPKFEAYAQAALSAGIPMPWPEKGLGQLDSAQLFRLASLGAWMEGRS